MTRTEKFDIASLPIEIAFFLDVFKFDINLSIGNQHVESVSLEELHKL